jgi:filamentous hemagglutinin family protein
MKQTPYVVTGHPRIDGAVLAQALHWWKTSQRLLVIVLVIGSVICTGLMRDGLANPVNPAVVAGEASVSGLGTDRVTIQQASQHAIIHWGQFNIAPNEVTSFLQPMGGVALNRIYDAHPSLINGALNATGTVFLLNPNGVLFGQNAQVNVGGLVASTLHLSDADFLAGSYRFGGVARQLGLGDTALNGMVRNEGQINAGPFGAYLFAHNVENAGIIRSPEGHIALVAGSSAYLSNRPDGRGLFVEVTAPTGQATNLKDLIADGGQVSLFGRVVNQSGVIQANSVQARNGRVELIASEAVTLADGSRILAKGDATGIANGGTVIAKADLAQGQTNFQKGALIDVSGGTQGGNGGLIELSGSKVSWDGAFRAHALAGYRGGKLLIDPMFDGNSPITTATLSNLADQIVSSGLNDVEFQSTADMTVTARFDLSGWLLPAGQVGTLTFNAGHNLLFNNAGITNGERGQGMSGSRWDYKLLANEHIEIRGSVLSTGSGGSITMEAGRSDSAFGDIRLTQLNTSLSGQTMVETFAGGDISITTDRDLIAPSGLVSGVMTGVRLNQQGNLTLHVGRNFLGGLAGSSTVGPGFLLGNGTALIDVGTNVGTGLGQHPAGGHIGWDGTPGTVPLYTNITVGGGRIDGSGKLAEAYKATVNVRAPGHVYWGLVQDRGLVEDVFETGDPYVTAHPDSSVVLFSSKGDIFLKPQLASSTGGINLARRFYPASLDAQAPEGKIVFESDLNFWPSITGRLNFYAKQDLAGAVRQVGTRKDPQYKLVFVGDSEATGNWQLLFLPTTSKDPALGRFIARPENQLSLATINKKPQESEFSEAQWPSIPQFSGAPVITQRQGDLKNLQGIFSDSVVAAQQKLPQGVDSNHHVQDVRFKSETGSIYSLVLNLLSPVFKKQVTVEAAQNIGTIVDPATGARTGGEFTMITSVPEGVTATVSAGGNMGFSRNCPTCTETGLEFFGRGTANVRVGSLDSAGDPVPGTGSLDLGDGRGIQHRSLAFGDVNAPGLIDIGVGNDITMTQTRIVSHNGADIWIHGLGTKPALRSDGSPSDQLVQGVLASNILTVDGKPVKVDGVTVVLDGTQPVISQGTVVLDRPGGLINGKSFMPVLAKGRPIVVDGRIVLLVDGRIHLVDASLVSIEQASGGKLTVGTFGSNPNSGILTIRGGSIDIKTKGDVDVFRSRIATLTGGNISVHSMEGDINAGSGGRNESIPFTIRRVDENGNPILDESGRPLPDLVFLVPGSGIFTHHGSDPKFPLNFPKFDSPEITALKGEIVKQNFLGRSTTSLEHQLAKLVEAREPVFRQIFERFIANNEEKFVFLQNSDPVRFQEFLREDPSRTGLPLELGDINLNAGRDLVVPSAGIRGRRIRIFAGRNLDLQGGMIEGEVQFDVGGSVKGSLSSFVGAFSGTAAIGGSVSGGASAGGSSLGGGLAGVSGTVSATASATSSTSGTASKTVETVQEKTTEASTQQARAVAEKQMVASSDSKDGKSKGLQVGKMKRGVVIQVDVKPQTPPGS